MVRVFFTEEEMMQADKLELAAMAVTVFVVLCWLAFWGGVIYVAWHFISKFW
jgi:hypothetical protein